MWAFLGAPSEVRPKGSPPRKLRALTDLARGVAQVLGSLGLAWLAVRMGPRGYAFEVVAKQIEIYLGVAGSASILLGFYRALGVSCDDSFHNPLAARSPADFWGNRWNSWVNAMLYRYVFLPAGGRRHPARGTLAAFAVSGIVLHEITFDLAAQSFCGAMMIYFGIQGLAVAATSRLRFWRRLVVKAPALAWALTAAFMLASGTFFVHAMDHVVDFHEEVRVWTG